MVRPWCIVVVAVLAMAGCASTAMPVMPSFPDPTDTGEPTSVAPGRAVAILGAGIADLNCAETRVVIARGSATGFSRVKTATIQSRFGKGAKAVAVELAPGEYHIAQVACRNGKFVRYVGAGAEVGVIPWNGKQFTQSLASFSVAEGQAADLGTLTIMRQKVAGFGGSGPRAVTFATAPMSDAARAEFAGKRATLAGTMQPRPMQVSAQSGMVLAGCNLASGTGGAKRPALPGKITTSGDMIAASRAAEPAPTECVATDGTDGALDSLLQ